MRKTNDPTESEGEGMDYAEILFTLVFGSALIGAIAYTIKFFINV